MAVVQEGSLTGYFLDLKPNFRIEDLDKDQGETFLVWQEALDSGVQEMHKLAVQTVQDEAAMTAYIRFVEGIAGGMAESIAKAAVENAIGYVGVKHLIGISNAVVSLCIQIGRVYERAHPDKEAVDGNSLG